MGVDDGFEIDGARVNGLFEDGDDPECVSWVRGRMKEKYSEG